MTQQQNPMACDMETGICGTAGEAEIETIQFEAVTKKATLYYVTDPICSHCWALEPVYRRFMLKYGQYVTVKTVMGGLLKKWEGFADVKNGISKPEDVASHWREVGIHSRMPIDGSVWLENPITSSYPPSRLFKVIQQESEELATLFLRRAREAVFAFNKNIAEDHVLAEIVTAIGLDGNEMIKKAKQPDAEQLLMEDFMLAGQLGATGFPSIIFVNAENRGIKIVGARPFATYVQGLETVLEASSLQTETIPTLDTLLKKEKRLFSREIEELYGVEQQNVADFITKSLEDQSFVQKEIIGELYIEVK